VAWKKHHTHNSLGKDS